MLIKEFRIPLPMTVEEYQIAQLFGVAEASKNYTGGGEGIEVIKNETFENFPLLDGQYSSGQYTRKIYHVASRVPAIIRMILPKGCLDVHEEAWNSYPFCRTVLTNPGYMKDSFSITIDSFHLDGAATEENVHRLSKEKLKLREVVYMDIANDAIGDNLYKEDEDPKLFKSTKTGRGPLLDNWIETATPLMTCYKLVTLEFRMYGLQRRAESVLMNAEQQVLLGFHRLVFCTLDKWYDLTMDEMRDIEEEVTRELNETMNVGSIRGGNVED